MLIQGTSSASSCMLSSALSCNVTSWLDKINSRKSGKGRSNDGQDVIGPKSLGSPAFNDVIKYSFYDSNAQKWVYCNETDATGEV